jgi:hypothetical protein
VLTDSVRKHLLRFCVGESDGAAFEAWVCAAPDVEAQIGHGAYLDLIVADYRGRDLGGARQLCATLLEQHHPGALARYRVGTILQSMLADDSALLTGLRKLVVLRHSGDEFIPIAFVGFDSETDTIPTPDHYGLWDPTFLAEKLTAAQRYFPTIRRACEELLAELRTLSPHDL